ncbi:sensor histidine kinase [Paenibacillus kandeliae]|uniref:sensor histidine kinase n=1 Tax=Paenibacillus kandeliae TaxID=3231269 RepID=UPI003458CA30
MKSSTLYYDIYLIFLFMIIFVIIFYMMTRKIVHDLINLEQGLTIIAQGNMDHRITTQREDELGRVIHSVNTMAAQLQQKIAQERELENSKMELINGISHDLRTPLTSVIGYMELLQSRSFRNEDEYQRFVQNAHNKALHLKKMLEDLFEYTRLAWKEARLHRESIDMIQMVNQLYYEFEPIAREMGIAVVKHTMNTSIYTQVDSEKIARTIDNLLNNALHHSLTPGTIQLVMKQTEQRVIIEITNEGIPLTKEQEKRLFERFYKVDQSRQDRGSQSGTGLGLSIARSIVELHGGELNFTHIGKWFTFTIELPLLAMELDKP